MAMSEMKTAAPSEAALQEFSARLSKLLEEFGMNCDRLQRAIDRAYGPSPESGSTGQPRAVPSGSIGSVRDRLEDLAAVASAQSSLLNRLDTVV